MTKQKRMEKMSDKIICYEANRMLHQGVWNEEEIVVYDVVIAELRDAFIIAFGQSVEEYWQETRQRV